MRGGQLVVRLVDVEGAGEGRARIHRRVAEAGEAAEHHVDLELAALGSVRGGALTQESSQHTRRGVHQHVPRGDRVIPSVVVGPDDIHAGRVRVHGADARPGEEFGATGSRRAGECLDDGAHAADRGRPSRPSRRR